MYVWCMLPAVSPHTWQPFISRQQRWTDTTAPEKKCSRLHLSAQLSGPRVPSPNPANETVGLSQASVDSRLLGLLGPQTPACDWYVQYLLPGTNPSVLNRHRQGLPHRNLRIATALSPPFPFECSTDPPNDPARSQIIHTLITKIELEREHTLNLTSGSLHSISTIAYHLSIALLMLRHHKMG
jgi:hypothetical protein